MSHQEALSTRIYIQDVRGFHPGSGSKFQTCHYCIFFTEKLILAAYICNLNSRFILAAGRGICHDTPGRDSYGTACLDGAKQIGLEYHAYYSSAINASTPGAFGTRDTNDSNIVESNPDRRRSLLMESSSHPLHNELHAPGVFVHDSRQAQAGHHSGRGLKVPGKHSRQIFSLGP